MSNKFGFIHRTTTTTTKKNYLVIFLDAVLYWRLARFHWLALWYKAN